MSQQDIINISVCLNIEDTEMDVYDSKSFVRSLSKIINSSGMNTYKFYLEKKNTKSTGVLGDTATHSTPTETTIFTVETGNVLNETSYTDRHFRAPNITFDDLEEKNAESPAVSNTLWNPNEECEKLLKELANNSMNTQTYFNTFEPGEILSNAPGSNVETPVLDSEIETAVAVQNIPGSSLVVIDTQTAVNDNTFDEAVEFIKQNNNDNNSLIIKKKSKRASDHEQLHKKGKKIHKKLKSNIPIKTEISELKVHRDISCSCKLYKRCGEARIKCAHDKYNGLSCGTYLCFGAYKKHLMEAHKNKRIQLSKSEYFCHHCERIILMECEHVSNDAFNEAGVFQCDVCNNTIYKNGCRHYMEKKLMCFLCQKPIRSSKHYATCSLATDAC